MRIDRTWLNDRTREKLSKIPDEIVSNWNEVTSQIRRELSQLSEQTILFYESKNSIEHLYLFCFCYQNKLIYSPISPSKFTNTSLPVMVKSSIWLKKTGNQLTYETKLNPRGIKANPQTVILLHTSGTSGIPKWVQVSETMIIENISRSTHYHGWQNINEQVLYSHLNFFHSGGLLIQALPAFINGVGIKIDTQFDVGTFSELIKSKKLRTTILLPSHLSTLKMSKAADSLDLGSVDSIVTGSQRINIDFYKTLLKFSCKKILNVFGATEFGPLAWVKEINHQTDLNKIDLGVCSDLIEWKLGDDNELLVAGEFVTPGYLGETREDWFSSKDVIKLMGGELYFEGKKEYLIRRNGLTFNIAMIESSLIKDVSLQNIMILSRRSQEIQPEELFLFIEINKGQEEKRVTSEIRAMVPKELGRYKIIFVKTWPRNENGKTDKDALIKMYL